MSDALTFTPIPSDITALTKTLGWQARRGNFVFTIVLNDISQGYGISVSFQPDYLATGPFESLQAATDACNHAADVLRQ